jgi:DNA-directed RNA polymerase subunit RPC12/RpoP
MAVFYKCDKCGKNIKGEAITFSFDDMGKKFFEKSFYRFDLCEKCSKPLAGSIKKSLFNKKIKSSHK